ncbi:uncharacterized protein F54H12.2-like [Haliotis asinina]|uniref:uncharacterized protein F54H12.2-like n=1 Tax=Haliotis asinina TaxID=109174 RepID=UPI003531F0CE
MDDFNAVAQNVNAGLVARWRVIQVELTGRLHCDLFLQDRYLVDGVPIKLELIRSPSDFYLMSAGDVECRLELTKADFHKDQLVGGQLPIRLVLGLVDNDAFAGSKEKNQFHFKHNNVTSLKPKLNGQEVHGTEIQSDFQNNSGSLKKLYMNLFRNTGHLCQEHPCNLTLDEFRNGFTLWVVDLTADLGADECHNYPRHTGKLGLELQFAEPLSRPVTLVCYEEYEAYLKLIGSAML